jgi:hypothetical protein
MMGLRKKVLFGGWGCSANGAKNVRKSRFSIEKTKDGGVTAFKGTISLFYVGGSYL